MRLRFPSNGLEPRIGRITQREGRFTSILVTNNRAEFQPIPARVFHVPMLMLSVGGTAFIYFDTRSITTALLVLLAFMKHEFRGLVAHHIFQR